MLQFAVDLDPAVARHDPAAHGRMRWVIARMAAPGVQEHPAQARIGQAGAALPGTAGEVRQRRERRQPLGRIVEGAIAIAPNEFVFGARLGRRFGRRFQILQRPFPLAAIRFAAQGTVKHRYDALLVRGRLLNLRPIRQVSCLFERERAVHQVQRLLRHRGQRPARRVRVGTGKIERPKEPGQILPIDETVDRPPRGKWRVRELDRRAAHGPIQAARGHHHAVPQGLQVQSPPIHPPQQPVLGIRSTPRLTDVARLAVRPRLDDLANQAFGRPAVAHQSASQIIEQLGVGGRIAAGAEIAGCADQSLPEQMVPDPIDPHARGQRIPGAGDRLSQFQPSAAVLERLTIRTGQNGQELPRHLRPAVGGIAAQEHDRLDQRIGIRQQQRRLGLLRLAGTGKDAVQRIVVGQRDWVVLVIVTASATDRQPHQAAADNIDAVVDNVLLVVDEAAAQGQESRRRGDCRVADLIRRDLRDQEAVVRQVLVERRDDPVAISVGLRIIAVFLEHVALGVGVPGHVQPVPSPAFAEMRRGEQGIDHASVGLVTGVAFQG